MAEINETDSDAPETINANELTRFRSPDFLTLYVNQVQMATTPWDIQLVFASLQVTGSTQAVLEEKAALIMSPIHAKTMARILTTQVQAYEEQFGMIQNIPTIRELEAQAKAQAEDDAAIQVEAEAEAKPKQRSKK